MMSRFCRYVEKVFDFGQRVKAIHDTRRKPRIQTAAIWLSAFFLFVTRRGSLNAIESELHRSKRFDNLIGSRKPSADRNGRRLLSDSLGGASGHALWDQPPVGSQQGIWQRRAIAVCRVGWA